MAKARELRTAQRGLGSASERSEPGPRSTTDPTAPGADPLVRGLPGEPGARPSAAVVGTIDMDAVFSRYEKINDLHKQYRDALLTRRGELKTTMAMAQEEAQMLPKLAPGSEDYKIHESRMTELKAHTWCRDRAVRGRIQSAQLPS